MASGAAQGSLRRLPDRWDGGCPLLPSLPPASSWGCPRLPRLALTPLRLGGILLCPRGCFPLALSHGGLWGPLCPSTLGAAAIAPSRAISGRRRGEPRAPFAGGAGAAGSLQGLRSIALGLRRCWCRGLEGREHRRLPAVPRATQPHPRPYSRPSASPSASASLLSASPPQRLRETGQRMSPSRRLAQGSPGAAPATTRPYLAAAHPPQGPGGAWWSLSVPASGPVLCRDPPGPVAACATASRGLTGGERGVEARPGSTPAPGPAAAGLVAPCSP